MNIENKETNSSISDMVLVVDYGSQYTMLITRRLRELGVYSEVVAANSDIKEKLTNAKALILSGGPASVTDTDAPKLDESLLELGLPVLGICYGMQVMAQALGAKVIPCEGAGGYGKVQLKIESNKGLFKGLSNSKQLNVWASHGDQIAAAPIGFTVQATADKVPVMAMFDEKRKQYALQFHPEVTHTDEGTTILQRFVEDVCGLSCQWKMPAYIEQTVEKIKQQIGDEKVLLGLSGGVDSAVAASLIEQAIPGQLTCVLVDNGLMRAGEVAQIETAFDHLGSRRITVDAQDEFLHALKDLKDPEAKRKAIGATFIDVFTREAKKIGEVKWLAQGTIYPDVIESAGSAHAAQIKSHHNVGGLPEKLGFKLLEPLSALFKDEVRQLGKELGLAKELLWRHPFPGPGLAVRVLGVIDKERVEVARLADAIFIEELIKEGYYNQVAQAFAVLLPIESVGVQGDGRTYENVVALRSVDTSDFMTADWSQLPTEFLAQVSSRITNEVKQISRVVYDITSKPPATVEWE